MTDLLQDMVRQAAYEGAIAALREAGFAPPATPASEPLDGGYGAVFPDGEKFYLSRPHYDATAEAKGGELWLFGQKVPRAGGKNPNLWQTALRIAQERFNDRNEDGELINLNAWDVWKVQRDGSRRSVGMFRDKIPTRSRKARRVRERQGRHGRG